jgi:hypothetical protein
MGPPRVSKGLVLAVLCAEVVFVSNYLAFSSVGTDYFLSQLVPGWSDDLYGFQNLVVPRIVSGAIMFSSSLLFCFYLFFCVTRPARLVEKALCIIAGAMLIAIPALLAVGDPTRLSNVRPASLLVSNLLIDGLLLWRLTVILTGK